MYWMFGVRYLWFFCGDVRPQGGGAKIIFVLLYLPMKTAPMKSKTDTGHVVVRPTVLFFPEFDVECACL